MERNCSLLHIGFLIASSFGSAQSGRFTMLGGRGCVDRMLPKLRQEIIGCFARYAAPVPVARCRSLRRLVLTQLYRSRSDARDRFNARAMPEHSHVTSAPAISRMA